MYDHIWQSLDSMQIYMLPVVHDGTENIATELKVIQITTSYQLHYWTGKYNFGCKSSCMIEVFGVFLICDIQLCVLPYWSST